jgi:hypothetical protein
MGPISRPQSVSYYQTTLHNIPEEQRPQLYREGNLKCRIINICFLANFICEVSLHPLVSYRNLITGLLRHIVNCQSLDKLHKIHLHISRKTYSHIINTLKNLHINYKNIYFMNNIKMFSHSLHILLACHDICMGEVVISSRGNFKGKTERAIYIILLGWKLCHI